MPLTDHQILHLNALLKDFQDTIAMDVEDKRKLQILKKYSETDWDVLLDKAANYVQWHIDKNKWPTGVELPMDIHDYIEKETDWNTV